MCRCCDECTVKQLQYWLGQRLSGDRWRMRSWVSGLIVVAIAISLSTAVHAQLPPLPGTSTTQQADNQNSQNTPSSDSPNQSSPDQSSPDQNSPAPSSSEPSSAVNRLLPEQLMLPSQTLDAAPIYLDGRTLFRVSAPAVEGQRPAEARADEIQQRLYAFVRQIETPPNVAVSVDSASNLPVVYGNDQSLLTVTNADAQLNSYASPRLLALSWSETLEEAFERYFRERLPAFLQQQAKAALGILIGATVLQLATFPFARRLRRRQIRLVKAQTQLSSDRHPNPSAAVPSTLSLTSVYEQFKARLDNRQKRKLNETERGLLLLFRIALWAGSLLWILSLFPYSRWITVLLLSWLQIPAQIFLLSGLAYAAVRLSSLVIDKVSLALRKGTAWRPEKSQRVILRFSTFSQVAKGIAGAIIVAITVLFSLAIAGIQIAPLLAGAGIAGIGISLAAQSLIKDIINGFLILLEDHFGIGDVISVNGLTGAVEYVNLRITQLRDTEGRLITIPNSQISTVQNLSMDWAQVDLSVTVAHHSDVGKVLKLLEAIATNLAKEPDWQQLILEPPDVLGVETLDYKGITVRLWLKTQPLQQWVVARELRARIKRAFDKEGIALGIPQEQITVHREERQEPQVPELDI